MGKILGMDTELAVIAAYHAFAMLGNSTACRDEQFDCFWHYFGLKLSHPHEETFESSFIKIMELRFNLSNEKFHHEGNKSCYNYSAGKSFACLPFITYH
eukprot:876056-Ditylum_brightwellii.AAC.1